MSQQGQQGQQVQVQKKTSRLRASHVVMIIVLVLLIIAIIQNSGKTSVKFLFWDLNMWTWLLIAASVLLGAVIGWVGHVTVVRRRRRKALGRG